MSVTVHLCSKDIEVEEKNGSANESFDDIRAEVRLYDSIQDENPKHILDMNESIITTCGPWSMSIINKMDLSFLYLRSQSSEVDFVCSF